MVLNESQVIHILRALRDRTADQKIGWYGEGGRLWIDLPNRVTVELSRSQEGNLAAVIKTGAEEILGRLDCDPGAPNGCTQELGGLYEVARASAAKSIYTEILDSLEFTQTASGEVVRRPEPVGGVSPETAAQVLRKMTGRWHLNYSHGEEVAEIKEDGRYFVKGRNNPVFQLTVVAVNDTSDIVEVAKDRPDGRRKHIEYLALSSTSMKGYAKHDGHALNYTRLGFTPSPTD